MRSVLLVLLGLIFLSSCGESLPKGIVSTDKMEKILLDVHVVDGRLSNLPLDSARSLIDPYYEQIFEYHRIDSNAFRLNVEYYAQRPTLLKAMYANIQAILSEELRKEQEKSQKIVQEHRIRDSIFHAKIQDSIYVAQKLALKNRMLRDILYRHEADSTKDKPVPYTFDRYSVQLFENLRLWKLDFGIRDTLMEVFKQNNNWNRLDNPTGKDDASGQRLRDSISRADSIQRSQVPRAIVDPKNKSNQGLINPAPRQ